MRPCDLTQRSAAPASGDRHSRIQDLRAAFSAHLHDIGMRQLLQRRDLPKSCRRHALLPCVHSHLQRGGQGQAASWRQCRLAGARADARRPSRPAMGSRCSKSTKLTFFRATMQSFSLSRALYTTPYVPSPSFAIFSYLQGELVGTKARRAINSSLLNFKSHILLPIATWKTLSWPSVLRGAGQSRTSPGCQHSWIEESLTARNQVRLLDPQHRQEVDSEGQQSPPAAAGHCSPGLQPSAFDADSKAAQNTTPKRY